MGRRSGKETVDPYTARRLLFYSHWRSGSRSFVSHLATVASPEMGVTSWLSM